MKKLSLDSFKNTELAFALKSDWDLKKAYLLFLIIKNNFVARIATGSANLAIRLHLPIKGIVKKTVFSHFCGGESIEESQITAQHMAELNVGAVLDYSVEGKHDEEAFDAVVKETIRTIENARSNTSIPYAVFKPTGVGSADVMEKVQLKLDLTKEDQQAFDRIRERYDTICQAAFDNDVRLLIDAEDSWYQNTVDDLVYSMMRKYNGKRAIIFNTYQMYRWISLGNIGKAHQMAKGEGYVLGAKLVRGAYMENERKRAKEHGYVDPICENKPATDQSYNDGLKYCIDNLGEIELFNGSHNEESNLYLTQLMEEAGLERNDPRVYFAQLYGMSDNITYVISDAGYNAAKYLPYGPVKFVMPYLIRRAEENTSVGGQSSRELTLIMKELDRRKSIK